MQISVAFVPPEPVRRALLDVVRTVDGAAAELDVLAEGALRIPVFTLGNLTRPDADRLCAALAEQAPDLDRSARVRFAGVSALEDGKDPGVSAVLEGETDALAGIAKALPDAVADHGFYVDRRRFHPRCLVASVTDATTLPTLQALVDALEAHRGPEWHVTSVEVLGRVHRDGEVSFDELGSLPTTRRVGPGDPA